ncbi:DNA polymerase III subunit beta [Leptolyngbyaceae cyanobacterium CCMR0082]|uniref:Beta sliding clamp n=2 Tax=Adonisia turfae TaxID=2950184 RepID=A0A6M0RZ85_9CYAN|nr:DNA polymerase III subunit beta [Adonisia turfae]MDV3349741.1 DNA polymerase III subunit beta [Leptothoe sp. LEGE 181152]NEZ57472.1 DNA polymerase III subunit beta [Adonisia turfae CCMR0081]NEZ61260.1 DNA polymerase III subunit beta [Adonisia turfae CCMR0082]
MKFVCSQGDLNTHLSIVSRAVPSRPNKPVLANILVKVDEDAQRITLTSFDETLGIQTSFSAHVEEGGMLTVPAKLLGDIVAKLPPEDLDFSQSNTEPVITLTCSAGEYQVRGMEATDYPNLPLVEDGQVASVSAESILEGLRGALFATSSDETKQVLTGVHVVAEPENLEFAATDGHRLAVVQSVDDSGMNLAIDVTVPGKALRELERLLQSYQGTEPISLRFDPTQVVFELGHQRITTRLLEGQYPNYRQLIPKQFERQLTIDRKQLMSALERIGVLADQRNNIVKLSIAGSAQTLALSVEAQEVGSGREEMSAQVTGEDLDIAFNVRYLLEGLRALPSPEVQLQCNSATSPAILTPVSGLQMTYLVMPVQIRS